VIDFTAAPAKFRVREINRNQAVAVGRKVFKAANRMESFVGAALLVACALIARRVEIAPFRQVTAVVVGVMWLIALAQFFWLRPRMAAIATVLDLINRRGDDPRYAQIIRMHRAYTALDLCKIERGLVTLALDG
jgi:hypothetical protein